MAVIFKCESLSLVLLLLEDIHASLGVASAFGTNLDTAHEDTLLALLISSLLLVVALPVVYEWVHHLELSHIVVDFMSTSLPLLSHLLKSGSVGTSNVVAPNAITCQKHLLGRSQRFWVNHSPWRDWET